MRPFTFAATAFVAGIILSAIGISLASDARAQGSRNCGPRAMVLDRLADIYGESRHSRGLGSDNQILEMLRSEETGTWSVLVTRPNGITCLVASGQAFEELAESLDPGDDT